MNIHHGILFSAIFSAILLSGFNFSQGSQESQESLITSPALPSSEDRENTTSETNSADQPMSSVTSDSGAATSESSFSSEEIPAETEPQHTELSPDNVFVDFQYIEDIEGITDPESCRWAADAAIEAYRKTDHYSDFTEYMSENPDCLSSGFAYGDYDDITVGEYLSEGDVHFLSAFVDDFDSSGSEEAFVLIEAPGMENGSPKLFGYVVLADKSGAAEIAKQYRHDEIAVFANIQPHGILDYGLDKQIIVDSSGVGYQTGSLLFGVKDGHIITHYALRGGYAKSDCFLYTAGWQWSGEFMVYDTSAGEYRTIIGKEIDIDDLYSMDSAGVLPPKEDILVPEAQLIGNKYYALGGSHYFGGVYFYIYEKGALVPVDKDNIRISEFPTKPTVYIEDYDKAVGSMVDPELLRGD